MARIARTHRETVRPNFSETDRPDRSEKRTASESREEDAGASHQIGALQERGEETEVETEVLYKDDLGNEVPRDEGVQEPAPPPDLSALDYSQMPTFSIIMGQTLVAKMVRQYPWRKYYSIYPPQPDQSAVLPPRGRVAIYVDQLEAGLRVPTTKFLRDCLRY